MDKPKTPAEIMRELMNSYEDIEQKDGTPPLFEPVETERQKLMEKGILGRTASKIGAKLSLPTSKGKARKGQRKQIEQIANAMLNSWNKWIITIDPDTGKKRKKGDKKENLAKFLQGLDYTPEQAKYILGGMKGDDPYVTSGEAEAGEAGETTATSVMPSSPAKIENNFTKWLKAKKGTTGKPLRRNAVTGNTILNYLKDGGFDEPASVLKKAGISAKGAVIVSNKKLENLWTMIGEGVDDSLNIIVEKYATSYRNDILLELSLKNVFDTAAQYAVERDIKVKGAENLKGDDGGGGGGGGGKDNNAPDYTGMVKVDEIEKVAATLGLNARDRAELYRELRGGRNPKAALQNPKLQKALAILGTSMLVKAKKV